MMEDLWTLFCEQFDGLKNSTEACSPPLVLRHPASCVNHMLLIFVDVSLLAFLLLNMVCRIASKKVELAARYKRFSTLQIMSAVVNGCVGLVYIGFGFWVLEAKLRNDHSVLPIHWWILYVFHGFTWLLVGLTASLRRKYVSKTPTVLLSVLSAGVFCFSAIFGVVASYETTVEVALDVLSFVGACLLLLCTCKGFEDEASGESDDIGSTLYASLNVEANDSNTDHTVQLTPFAKAGWFSEMSFLWLNPLMKLGRKKMIKEDDIPKLRPSERAQSCYLQFMDQSSKQKEVEPSSRSSLFWAIISCNRREIVISGLFALVSILSLSTGPLLLNAFVKVAEGKQAFKYEGYFLVIALFCLKIMESLSQRQWYFRSRLIGLKVRSLLTASVYRKQLKLSSVARITHSGGEIMNYVSVDAYRIGEFCFWFHQTWTIGLQICIGVVILIYSVGLATFASLVVIILTVVCNIPLAKFLHQFQSKLMVAQDERLKACSEALMNMKVLKLYAWETYFKNVIEELRKVEYKWLLRIHFCKGMYSVLYWISPALVSAVTFAACYFLGVPLHASNVFTFVATLRLVQEPMNAITDVVGVTIHAMVAFTRIVKFLEAPELQTEGVRNKSNTSCINHAILIKSTNLSWEMNPSKPTLRNISLDVQSGEKIAICGEVSSGKSTLLAAILGEVPYREGTVEVCGKIAYVSQTAWILTGTIRENILFGSPMDDLRYQETLRRCSLVKDLELLPFGDMTEIGERGVNLSGGQKQRIQLARALYRDADVYLLDDPFSAVDANTATSLFNEYVMEALSEKTVLLVTHQVDFLPAFHRCLLMSDGQIIRAGPYNELLASSHEFLNLVNAHKETAGTEGLALVGPTDRHNHPAKEIKATTQVEKQYEAYSGDQLIKEEERDVGDTGLKPYWLYLKQKKGYIWFVFAVITHLLFVAGQIAQNSWMASGVDNPHVSEPKLIVVYVIIGSCAALVLPFRTAAVYAIVMNSSKSLFSLLLNSLFRAPLSFYDCTPLGRILSRVSVDLSIVDLDIGVYFFRILSATVNTYVNIGVLAVISWQVLLITVPVIYMATLLQRYYFATAKELMRINGTTKSLIANHLAESVAGATTIRAFEEQDRFFAKSLNLLDTNASPFFHYFAANEWLIVRLETLNAIVLSAATLCMVLLPPGSFKSGFIGMALSYGLSLNNTMVISIQDQCSFANSFVSVERLDQYMHIPSEAQEVIEDNRPPRNWPSVGKVDICDLQIRYRPDAPLVVRGISCTFEGGDKIGIVGRTGSGKTTLIGALFRLVEPAGGKIVVDNVDICSIGLHDLRSRLGIIPQDPTLFNGTVRFNLDPLSQHNDVEIWEVLSKCQLKESVQEKKQGLDSLVVDDGSNWSMGQRQLFCLGRALLRRSRVLVLDEATASIDNATDMILQKTIRKEFSDCTVITVAHRIPTVMDCTKVLAISDGKLVEYDEPMKLMKKEGSLFGQLVNEYWSHFHSAELH